MESLQLGPFCGGSCYFNKYVIPLFCLQSKKKKFPSTNLIHTISTIVVLLVRSFQPGKKLLALKFFCHIENISLRIPHPVFQLTVSSGSSSSYTLPTLCFFSLHLSVPPIHFFLPLSPLKKLQSPFTSPSCTSPSSVYKRRS